MGEESNCALTTGAGCCGGTDHTLGSRDNQGTCPSRGQRADERDGAEGDGKSAGQGTELWGSHSQLFCSRTAISAGHGPKPPVCASMLLEGSPCSSAMAERQTVVPRSPPHPSVSGSFSPCPASSAITGGHGDGWGSHAGDRLQTRLRCCLLPPQRTTCHHILV